MNNEWNLYSSVPVIRQGSQRLPLLIAHKTSYACLSADREVLQYRVMQNNSEPAEISIKLMIYPNPNSGQLNIGWSEISGNVNYTLINALGQIVKKWNSADVLQSLDLSKTGISNGLYFIQAQSEDGKMHQQKFIYQR